MRASIAALAVAAVALVAPACSSAPATSQEFRTEKGAVRMSTVASGLEHPWGRQGRSRR
jgi:hypothetical protein